MKSNQNKIYTHKINKYILQIFCYFVLNNDILKRNKKPDAQIHEFSGHNCIQYFVDIAANVTTFFRYKFAYAIDLREILFAPKKNTPQKK